MYFFLPVFLVKSFLMRLMEINESMVRSQKRFFSCSIFIAVPLADISEFHASYFRFYKVIKSSSSLRTVCVRFVMKFTMKLLTQMYTKCDTWRIYIHSLYRSKKLRVKRTSKITAAGIQSHSYFIKIYIWLCLDAFQRYIYNSLHKLHILHSWIKRDN